MWKTAASLPSIVAEVRGQSLQNGRRLLWAETDHMVPV